MKNKQAQAQAHYCFKQEAGSNVVQLYIYDDVSEYGEFDWWTWEYKESETSAKYFKKALEKVSASDTIELHINSYGGSVKEGVAIYNLLKQKKCKEIVAYVDGFAYSIASVIMQAADRRIMGLGTSLLIHNMWLTIAGNAEDLRKAADDLDVLMESNRQIYLERANVTEEELIDMMNKETYLTPDQAVEMGFADEVDSKQEADPEDTMQAMQQQLQQMRKAMTEQKAFRTELLEFCKTAQKKKDEEGEEDDEDENDEDDDSADGTGTDEDDDGSTTADDSTDGDDDSDDDSDDEDEDDEDEEKDQKKKKDPKESTNKRSLAALLAQAATKNLERR